MSQEQRDYSWAAHLDYMEGGVRAVSLPPARNVAWPARKHDCGASLDCMEGGWTRPAGPPPAGTATRWLAKNRDLFIRGILAATSIPLVCLWLGKHGFWSFIAGGAGGARMLLSALALSVAGFAQGLTGFGYSLVASRCSPCR